MGDKAGAATWRVAFSISIRSGGRDAGSARDAAQMPCAPLIGEKRMKPRITVLTLGVDDLDKAVAFYRDGLGWPTQGIVGTEFEHGAVAFFDLQNGLKLALWPRDSLAHDAGVAKTARCATELSLGYNVNSVEEVDAAVEQARRAGARIVKNPGQTFWGGYAAYVEDPDGHLWEVLWNPQLKVDD